MKHQIITLMIVLGFVCCCKDSKPSNNSTPPDNDGVLFLGEVNYSPTDTVYPILITDSIQKTHIVTMLRNKFVPQEDDFHFFNLEEGKYYLLGKFLIVNCMLVGPSGWASNFRQYFIIDVNSHRSVHIMSLSNNINNFYLFDNLTVNSIEYPDRFWHDTEFFDHFFDAESTTFKLINTIIETDSLSPISTKEFEKTIKWKDVYEYLVPQVQ
ncbi:MAG: hypothetical protein MJZ87_06305 [Bacteroidales bacterium]|nr:hypothetical protein [Bacteroidales bacterium]